MNELPHNKQNDYTDSEIRLRPLVIFLGATLAITAVTLLFVSMLFNSYANDANEDSRKLAELDRLIEANRPTNAVVEGLGEAAESMRRLRAEEDARLNHYAWVDAEAGTVQVPIDRAMEMLVAQGVPVRDGSAMDAPDETPVEAGQRLFTELGCVACHGAVAGALGPSLNGVYGHTVDLADGTQVEADEAYIRKSILEPLSDLVAGYPPVMPAFQGVVSDDQLDQLVAYIKDLADQ